MSKMTAKIGVAAAIVAATFIGVTVSTASPAAASGGACNDFAKILDYYLSVGDQTTADALFVNMVNAGCY